MARYEEIAADMRRRIETGEWGGVGDQIPTVSELMELYDDAASQTIRSAQAVLIDERLLAARQGVGVFIVQLPNPHRLNLDQVDSSLQAAAVTLGEARRLLRGQPLPVRVRVEYRDRESLTDGTRTMAILCEVCNQPITPASAGIVSFRGGSPPNDVSTRFVHKGNCDVAAGDSWDDLEKFLEGLLKALRSTSD